MANVEKISTLAKSGSRKRKKPGLFLPDEATRKKGPYLLDKLAQLSHSLKISELTECGDFLLYVKFEVKKYERNDLEKWATFVPKTIKKVPCHWCKVPIQSKIRVERPGIAPYWKKCYPRPKLCFIRKYADIFLMKELTKEHLQAWDLQEKKENSKYLFSTQLDKFETDEKELDVDRKILLKKAKAKHFTYTIVNELIQLDSPLQPGYKRTVECASELVQQGNKLTGKYCKNRWCITCNRIRTAQLINGYTPILNTFDDPQFLTLTIPNMPGKELVKAINAMQHVWREIYRMVKRPKSTKKFEVPIMGLKKLECTYNSEYDTFHPHYHFIVESDLLAELLMNSWLKYWNSDLYLPKGYKTGKLSKDAQKYKPITSSGGFLELFKYFTKIITTSENKDLEGIYINPLDTIFRSMQNRRTFEPIGIKKVSEDINDIQSATYIHLAHEAKFWSWLENDWVCNDECLTGHNPSGTRLQSILDKIIQ